ncbi:MAG TPA: NAD(P)-binding domain-containing protein [Vicinamibacterales bacterium]|nr:NAD(P)-binding domain-containing protein [Vicinamibacterales bacterium]
MSRKIGIIGSGIVGETLANGFIKHGYQVTIGTNTPAKRDGLRTRTNGQAIVGTFEDAARFGELVVLATKGSAAEAALKLAGTAHLTGKTVIDTCNPIAGTPPVNGVLQYFTPQNDSLMERLQRAVPDVRFVKAFSCIGNAFMVDPDFNGEKPTMFNCGNDEMAKADVRTLLEQFGHEVADMGTVEAARAIEPLCIRWCIPGFRGGGWTHAFKLLRK